MLTSMQTIQICSVPISHIFWWCHFVLSQAVHWVRLVCVLAASAGKRHDIVFVTFHSNPIGGHFNAYCTFHRIGSTFIGHECALMVQEFANPAPVVCYQTPLTHSQASWFITSPSRRPWWSFMSMVINAICFLHAVEGDWPLTGPWHKDGWVE